MYEEGKGVPQSDSEATRWYDLAAELGNEDAKLGLERISRGEVEKFHIPERYIWGIIAECRGLPLEQFYHGSVEENDDLETALFDNYGSWRRVENKLRDAEELYDIGYNYYVGETVDQSYEEALKWFTPAAKQGHVYARYYLGVMYYFGKGVRQSYKKARWWFELAAGQGDPNAQYFLGVIYFNGYGVSKSYDDALKWFELASDQGDPYSQCYLGLMYELGKGVPRSYDDAVWWYRLAADQGYSIAQYNLGNMYRYGRGVPVSIPIARGWYKLAADQGDEDALKALREI